MSPPEHAPSVWRATARIARPAAQPLGEDRECDVAVIGAGFTGLATAHFLCEAGMRPVVLEAMDLAWGASGRTAGMAGTRYKRTYSDLATHYGTPTALLMHRLAHEAIGTLEAIVAHYRIPGAFARTGQLIPAHAAGALAGLASDVAWLAAEAGDHTPRILDAAETAREIGSAEYVGAWLDARGGAIQPVDYVHGLAAGLIARGVAIHVETPVTAVADSADGVVLTTPHGRVRARQAILATDAYAGMALRLGDLHRRFVPVSASIVATEPLSDNVAKSILPGRRVASDTKRLLHAFRMLPDNRLLFAGRADVTGRRAGDPASYGGIERVLARTFPQVGEPRIGHRWSGMVAMAADAIPHIGRHGKNVLYALGFSGRGVTLTALLGKHLARMATGDEPDLGPMSHGRFAPIPLQRLRVPILQVLTTYYGIRDALAR
ncbi:MAG: FAD-binding oxidoreductase [Alphaproteobacteria bacterium]|nr:FAD-binding oxidoreductase [Alphaproteobacteria bacterium]